MRVTFQLVRLCRIAGIFLFRGTSLSLWLLLGLVASSWPIQASVHYVAAGADPGAADGSTARPWPSVSAALQGGSVRSGDEIRLATGTYGDVVVEGAKFDKTVTIGATAGAAVHMTSLKVNGSRNLVIEDIGVWPVTSAKGFLVQTDFRSADIVFRRLDIRGWVDAERYLNWSLADWVNRHRPGIMLRGPDNALEDSRLLGTAFAIATIGPRARVERNLVAGFSGDGIRGIGDNSVFRGNRVQDRIKMDANHPDGFQSWSRGPDGGAGGGVNRGLVIEGNVFLEWTGPTNHPLRGGLQGIGLFDGMFQDFVIRNNVVSVSAYHGISVGGALDGVIENNTVLNSSKPGSEFPWIAISPHRNGTISERVVIANNIVPKLMFRGPKGPTIQLVQNLLTQYPALVLRSPYTGDFRLTANSAAIDKGDPRYAPEHDIVGTSRRAGNAPDIGAYETP